MLIILETDINYPPQDIQVYSNWDIKVKHQVLCLIFDLIANFGTIFNNVGTV